MPFYDIRMFSDVFTTVLLDFLLHHLNLFLSD